MPTSPSRKWKRIAIWSVAGLVLLVGIVGCSWQRCVSGPISLRTDGEAFEHGSIGTEFAPVVAMDVLPDMFPEYFQPLGPQAGDWIDQFGLNRSDEARDPSSPVLPRGFTISSLRPASGSASPIPFVGIGCAACHTNTMLIGGHPIQIPGGGGASVNIIAFSEALRATILDERLTTRAVEDAYKHKRGRKLGWLESFAVSAWIDGFRQAALVDVAKYDTPFTERPLEASLVYPAGPGRTRAFRSLVRVVMDRPGEQNWAITKIPAVYSQRLRTVAQFDGSIADHDSRSALAALTAGATPQALASRQIADNIRRTTRYTADLPAPKWADAVGVALDPERVARGRTSYAKYCFECHGGPDDGGKWQLGPKTGKVIPLREIGTDPSRVKFPHAQALVPAINKFLPVGHPFHPGDKITTTDGYVSAPIDGAFSRAPYLHNGSVLTLAELLNLEDRRSVFFRGQNEFDEARVGLKSPDQAAWDTTPLLKQQLPFRFVADPGHPGNATSGHDYPWPRKTVLPGSAEEKELKDLLEYLKSL